MMYALWSYQSNGLLKAQSVIAFQGFEGLGSDNWTFTPPFQNAALPQVVVGANNYGPGYSNTGNNSMRIGGGSQTCGLGSANCINGSANGGSCQNNQNGNSVVFEAVNTSCFENIRVSAAYRTHVLCTSPTIQGQGFDSGDRVYSR
jgi:hypothetical protein